MAIVNSIDKLLSSRLNENLYEKNILIIELNYNNKILKQHI